MVRGIETVDTFLDYGHSLGTARGEEGFELLVVILLKTTTLFYIDFLLGSVYTIWIYEG